MTDTLPPLTSAELADLKAKAKVVTPDYLRQLAKILMLTRYQMAWGNELGAMKVAKVWPPDERAWRAYPHEPNAEIDMALAQADAGIADANSETILRLIDMIEQRDAWRPVETAPPTEADRLFLAFVPPCIMGCALVENGKIVWPREGESEEAHGVTKWQPLPAPPSEALAATEPPNE